MPFDNTHSLTAILRSLDRIINQDSPVNGNGTYSMNTLRAQSTAETPIEKWSRIYSAGDAERIAQLQQSCIEYQKSQDPPPENLFDENTINIIRSLQKGCLVNSQQWIDSDSAHRNVNNAKYYPAIAYLQNGSLAGFEYLCFKLGAELSKEYEVPNGVFNQGPTLTEEGSSYYTFYVPTSMAMLVKKFEDIHTPAVRNLHIICKGYSDFNKDGLLPRSSDTGELLPWYLDTWDAINLEPFVKSVLECAAFQKAAKTPSNGQPLRRIMVWLLERSHFEQFGWDTLYDSDGRVIRHILFMVSTVPGKDLWNNPHGHERILEEFKKKLIDGHYISDENTKLIYDLKCSPALRESVNRFDDIWCVLFAGFSTPILANVFDIEKWDGGNGMDADYWNFCRAGYHRFEKGLINKIASITKNGNNTLWMCPEVEAKHLNIKDVYLLKGTNGQSQNKIEFSWLSGWQET